MGRTVINVVRTSGPTHLAVLFGNKICLIKLKLTSTRKSQACFRLSKSSARQVNWISRFLRFPSLVLDPTIDSITPLSLIVVYHKASKLLSDRFTALAGYVCVRMCASWSRVGAGGREGRGSGAAGWQSS